MPNNSQILGTVIASVLDYDHLIKITGDPTVINPHTSVWIPADGRSIANSELSKQTGLTNAPDLRGRFIRGLNTIYSIGQPALVVSAADEDDPNSNRKAGEYQGDTFRLHAHSASGHINGSVSGSNNTHDVSGGGDKWNSDPNFGDHNVVVSVQPFGGAETRPKNVSTYYYVKIN
ncbi:hypothetical protein [Mucilaginibacter sp.]|uniref:hypothetical protein n=1 Tax=Mucilaginibacter sp. TaxID=1882438 RepID=UPI003D0FB08B